MKKIAYISIVLLALILSVACEEDKYEKEFNWSYPLSGDWTIKVSDGTDTYGPYFIKTYNASFGQDSIWIDDNQAFWPFKVKAKANVTGLSFESSTYVSYPGEDFEDQVSIKNAKVVGKDSIFFEAEFGSDPGTTYQFSGHRRVSYDEYNSHN